MKNTRNTIIQGNYNKPITLDVAYKSNGIKKPIIIFCHGFKGFKDWGHFNLVSNYFSEQNFVFLKFNFSHNGTTPKKLTDFDDLEAFGNNNFSIELDDLNEVINWVESNKELEKEIDLEQLFIIGHSRGGGIVLIKSSEDSRIKKVVTWAAVSDFEKRIPATQIKEWQKNGVIYSPNTRTQQMMPMYIQFYNDFIKNRERFYITKAVQSLKQSLLFIQGAEDEAVTVDEALYLKKVQPNAELFLVEGADHVFGATHPFTKNELPNDVKLVLKKTLKFFESNKKKI